ncbi:hypothetical protein BSP239C_02910 [Brevibacterium sp. 239c]|uniref:hypothetical protein n=1 Tax=Brevibacterium sp. 239c TaxID=1965356 RepID=UPI000C6599A8|nr:hypothetical protein [Brevibacterium sp. 239c]SMX98436.1 hypothetical protein BSP239C_02910 [Brevibacterium sp. 239c]
MATDYSPERLALMAEELFAAAQALGISLPQSGTPSTVPNDEADIESDASGLVTTLLDSSSTWAATIGSRAAAPFGAFLAGSRSDAQTKTAASACARVEDVIAALSRCDE